MATTILTDYFTWNVLSWIMLFLFTTAVIGLMLFVIIKNHSKGLLYKEPCDTVLFEESNTENRSNFKMDLIYNSIKIWLNAPASDVAAILMLILFFAVAVIFH